eukprot:Opistho-1_new@17238
MTRLLAASSLFTALLLASLQASAVVLITEDEARLPKAPKTDSRAGLTRGPAIEVVSPKADELVGGPVRIVVRFQPRNGAKIATDSVRLLYMANPRVDLTPRVAGFVKEEGIAIPDAEMPPGNYQLLLQVKDSEGRPGSEYINLKVGPK